MTLSVKQINALQPLKPPPPPNIPPTTSTQCCWSGLFRLSPLELHFTAYTRLCKCISDGDGELDCHYLSLSPPTALPLSPPICLTFRQSPLSVALLSPHCQASGGSHLKITRPGHTQPSPTACQFTHGKGITRLLLGSRKLLLMVMQIIRVRLAPPANLFFMWVHS